MQRSLIAMACLRRRILKRTISFFDDARGNDGKMPSVPPCCRILTTERSPTVGMLQDGLLRRDMRLIQLPEPGLPKRILPPRQTFKPEEAPLNDTLSRKNPRLRADDSRTDLQFIKIHHAFDSTPPHPFMPN